MKKLLTFILLVIITVQFSCKKKQEDDVYLYLTQEQKDFINTAKTGDTVIWESDAGVKDTAIVQAVVYDTYVIDQPRNGGKTIGEQAYYLYHFVGTKKTKLGDGIFVQATKTNLRNNGWLSYDDGIYKAESEGVIASKKLGAVTYENVYWTSPANAITDTTFFNDKGYLGYKKGSESVVKIK